MNTGVMDPLNPTEAEFDTAMTEIDEELRRKSSRVVAREMLALAEYCHRYNVTIANYQPIAKRIFDWCKRLYGDRLNIDWDFGRTVVLVKGGPLQAANHSVLWRDADCLFAGADGNQADSGNRRRTSC